MSDNTQTQPMADAAAMAEFVLANRMLCAVKGAVDGAKSALEEARSEALTGMAAYEALADESTFPMLLKAASWLRELDSLRGDFKAAHEKFVKGALTFEELKGEYAKLIGLLAPMGKALEAGGYKPTSKLWADAKAGSLED